MKKFKLEEVLSAIYGILLCEIGSVYEVLNFVTGDNLFTHQLPRAGEQCKPLIENQHPFLKDIDLTGINPDNWKERLDAIKEKYPNEIDLIPVSLRRITLNLIEPVEISIYNTMQEIEELGASVGLTKAIVLLSQVRNLVADFIETPNNGYVSKIPFDLPNSEPAVKESDTTNDK